MKKGICLGCLPGNRPLEERFALAADAGFQGVELGTLEDDAARADARAAAARVGVELPSIMASGHWKYPLSSPDAETRRQGIQNIRDSVDTAVAVGATHVLVVPAVVRADQSYEETWELSLASLRELAPYAQDHGICLAVENVWNRFLLTPREMEQYLALINSPDVGLYFDCGNILNYGFPEQWIRDLASRLMKVHVKDFDSNTRQFRHLLQGSVNWAAVRAALAEANYDDYLTVELPLYPNYGDQMVYDSSNQLDRIIAGA